MAGAMVHWDSNKIYVSGSLGASDYRRVLVAMHQIVQKGYQDIILDFSHCSAAYAAAMLPICSQVSALQFSKVDCEYIAPSDEKLRKRFSNVGWAYYLEPRKNPLPKPRLTDPYLSVIKFNNVEEQADAVNKVVSKILSLIPDLYRDDFSAVEWSLNEITDNVLNHSQSSAGGFLQFTRHMSGRPAVEFTVCDAGIGIPRSLKPVLSDSLTDEEVLEQAVKEGVTSNKETNQGNGLFGSLEVCRLSGGRFSLHSGFASLEINKGVLAFKRENIPLVGTMVDVLIDMSDRGVLAKALKFDGRQHSISDYIEHRYESDDLSRVVFVLSDECRSFGSRIAARPVRVKIDNLLEMCPQAKIFIDFSDVSIISSSFADEVFGMLFAKLGPLQFMSRIEFLKMTPLTSGLINRAISQRMANQIYTQRS